MAPAQWRSQKGARGGAAAPQKVRFKVKKGRKKKIRRWKKWRRRNLFEWFIETWKYKPFQNLAFLKCPPPTTRSNQGSGELSQKVHIGRKCLKNNVVEMIIQLKHSNIIVDLFNFKRSPSYLNGGNLCQKWSDKRIFLYFRSAWEEEKKLQKWGKTKKRRWFTNNCSNYSFFFFIFFFQKFKYERGPFQPFLLSMSRKYRHWLSI